MPDAGQRERGDGSFFLGKKKEPKKNRLGFLPFSWLVIVSGGYAFLFILEAAGDYCFNTHTCYESAACVGGYYSQLSRFYFFFVSGYRESELLI